MSLKYLFTAYYDDGTYFAQTPEDVSVTRAGGSCFSDVDHSRLTYFEINDGQNCFGVDLTDGNFVINGEAFRAYPLEGLGAYTLVFARRHTHAFSPDLAEQSHTIGYRIGWKALVQDGAEIERVMEVR